MEIAGAAELAMTMKRAEFSQELGIKVMKQSLQQDAAVLQIVAAATQPAASPGVGQVLDISV
ncbi:MAG: putative motility protein [Magnetospirillum sp.]|nr:putative motility protein [Magnetospirillum sp.]